MPLAWMMPRCRWEFCCFPKTFTVLYMMASYPHSQYLKRRPRRRSVLLCVPKKQSATYRCPSSFVSNSRTWMVVWFPKRSAILPVHRLGPLWFLFELEWSSCRILIWLPTVWLVLKVSKHQKYMRQSDEFTIYHFQKSANRYSCLPSRSSSRSEMSDTVYTPSVISHRIPLLKSELKYLLRFMDASAFSRKTDGKCDADFKTLSFWVYDLRCMSQCLQVFNASCKSWHLVPRDVLELYSKRNRVWCEWYISRLPARYPTYTIILVVYGYPETDEVRWMSASSGIFFLKSHKR